MGGGVKNMIPGFGFGTSTDAMLRLQSIATDCNRLQYAASSCFFE
jgi:hypothetical protein